jgi:hypothetical protein
MQAVITDPGGIARGEAGAEARRHIDLGARTIEQVCEASAGLTARDRLGIYANMYYWRLVDVLAEEYPTVHHLLGPRRFYRVAVDYLVAHPSRSYTLTRLSIPFADFLAREAKALRRRALLADVARVERAIEDVFDAAAPEPMTTRELRRVPMEKWAAGRLVLAPFRLLELDYPVNSLIAAVRKDLPVKAPRKRTERLVVYQSRLRVWRAPLSREAFTLLKALGEGKRLPEAFEACAGLRGFDEAKFTRSLQPWFKGWAAADLICGVE